MVNKCPCHPYLPLRRVAGMQLFKMGLLGCASVNIYLHYADSDTTLRLWNVLWNSLERLTQPANAEKVYCSIRVSNATVAGDRAINQADIMNTIRDTDQTEYSGCEPYLHLWLDSRIWSVKPSCYEERMLTGEQAIFYNKRRLDCQLSYAGIETVDEIWAWMDVSTYNEDNPMTN